MSASSNWLGELSKAVLLLAIAGAAASLIIYAEAIAIVFLERHGMTRAANVISVVALSLVPCAVLLLPSLLYLRRRRWWIAGALAVAGIALLPAVIAIGGAIGWRFFPFTP